MIITLICNYSLALVSVVLLIIHSRSSDKFFHNEKVQNLIIIWYYIYIFIRTRSTHFNIHFHTIIQYIKTKETRGSFSAYNI